MENYEHPSPRPSPFALRGYCSRQCHGWWLTQQNDIRPLCPLSPTPFPARHKNEGPAVHTLLLSQCAKIACADGQFPEYVQRALYQCHALETQAKATNGGYLPYGW
ncbi:hypothetical protein BDK51DRAFT_48303 [Blyttiomyces helicus]|uniref:Uncharacterized protein n=1 Tax=Blyttiomyces helicus TaxID=388810 RepID=A0A4P9VYZ5_9FUNG|nr:hypothetical protein BDK51DRAFT_48303 [Blyttiomyces helicus]|eukprot:RKO83993.1 hypothetical protein BDK51DRAFT_48303 [Blyttiomyces helicus]